MSCWKCGSENITCFSNLYLFIKHHWFFTRKTDLQLLMFCNDCGMTGILCHEYKNDYQRTYGGRHTGHYEATHVHPGREYFLKHEKFEKEIWGGDGFAAYISMGTGYFYSKLKTPFNARDERFGKCVGVEYSDSVESDPKTDVRGDYFVNLPASDMVIERHICIK
jgi:hypothetical protein